MTPERWRVVKEVFQEAVLQDNAERAAYLAHVCADDPSLRAEVEDMLTSDDHAASFIEAPAFEVAADLLIDAEVVSPIGTVMGQYQILSTLGAGGMGEVYLAQHTTLGRRVALKVLTPALVADPQSRARFVREAQLASALDHANVCTIYEVGTADGKDFISMQHVEGSTLKRVINGRPLSVERVISVGLQTLNALQTAHALGIVHCDINSNNIMVTPHGQVKVLDFGLAKLVEPARANSATELSRSGATFGTPSSMSPEQARGERADHRSDIFSCGVVLYEMATGQMPFTKRSAAETMAAIINEHQPPIGQFNTEVPPGLIAVIDRALNKDPACRYQSAQEMLTALGQSTQGHDLSVPQGLDGTGVPNARRRRRWPRADGLWSETRSGWRRAAVGAFILALLGSLGAGTYWRAPGRGDIDSLAVLPFASNGDTAETDYLADGLTESLTNSLSRLPRLRVVARSTMHTLKERHPDPRIVGREFGVAAVLTGLVARQGDSVRIRLELVDAKDGARLWGEEHTRVLSEVTTLPGELVTEVSRTLRLRLSGDERRRLMTPDTSSSEAYQLYTRGRYFSNRRTIDGYRKGIEYFRQAIERDPAYARAYSGLADSYNLLGGWLILPPSESYPKARAAAEQALRIDDSLAEAHTSLALFKSYSGDWSGAEVEFKRAIQVNPNDDTAHRWYGSHLAAIGRLHDGMVETRRAQDLDPLSLNNTTQIGRILYLSRQYDQAIAQYHKTLEMDAGFGHAYFLLGWVYEKKGMYAEALAAYTRADALGARATAARVGRVYALSGQRNHAQKVLDELHDRSLRSYVPPYDFALIHAGLGDATQALTWLEKAAQEGGGRNLLKMDPTWDDLRSDPRFRRLLDRIGFPE